MNRGQLKRIRKELERLKKGGKEWEALRLIEHDNALEEFRPEWGELWQNQARHALRTAPLMEQFLQRINEFTTVPDTSDIRFMRVVGDYLCGIDVTATLSGMSGLSASAEALRRELLRKGSESVPSDTKLRKLLLSFATTPEKIMQKDFRALATLLAPCSAMQQKACDTLVDILTRSRKLNSASTIKNYRHGVPGPVLSEIDHDLNKIASKLPPAFSKVVIAPILAQVCAALERVAESAPDNCAHLALAAPFCMENLAAADWPQLYKKIMFEVGQSFSAADLEDMQKTARTATFEARLQLLNKLTRDISQDAEYDENLQNVLILLFKGILKEMAVRRATISGRDQRKLAAVFGPFFSKNMSLFYNDIEDLPPLLDAVASVGCLDTVSTLLHTLFAVASRDRNMLANARMMLKISPPINRKDIDNFFNDYQPILACEMKHLKGMLDICRECGHELETDFADVLGMSLLSLLVMNTVLVSSGRFSFLNMMVEELSGESALVCKKMIKGIDSFAANPAFALPVVLAKSFSSGKITGKEFRCYLESQSRINVQQAMTHFVNILRTILETGEMRLVKLPFSDTRNYDLLVNELLAIGLEILCDKKEQVMQHSTSSLAIVAEIIWNSDAVPGLERYMLLIDNTANERMQAGDEAAKKLHESAIAYITKALKTKKKKGTRR